MCPLGSDPFLGAYTKLSTDSNDNRPPKLYEIKYVKPTMC